MKNYFEDVESKGVLELFSEVSFYKKENLEGQDWIRICLNL